MNLMNRRFFTSLAAWAVASPLAFAQQAATAVDPAKLNVPSPLGDMVLGKDDAKVTIIEYASASCPHCAEFANVHLPKLKTEYVDTGKVRMIFREFPHNDAAMGAFMIARCAPKEKYFPLLEVMFKTQDKWVPNPLQELKAIALQAGFTEETFLACLNDKAVAEKIFAVRQHAETLGVESIPTFFINGVRYSGEFTFDAMKVEIDRLLAT